MSRKPVPKSWKLIKASLADLRLNWWSYVRLIVIVEIPIGILSIWLGSDNAFGAYSSLASIVMNMAVIFAVAQITTKDKRATIKDAYYKGTRRFVPFLLASLALLAVFIPVLIGIAVYALSTVSQEGYGVSIGQQVLGLLIGLILAIPSFWFGLRLMFAPYAVMLDSLDPIAAIKFSRQLTLSNYWLLFSRVIILTLVVILVYTITAIPRLLFGQFTGSTAITPAFQVLTTCLILPFIHSYLLKLYRALSQEAA